MKFADLKKVLKSINEVVTFYATDVQYMLEKLGNDNDVVPFSFWENQLPQYQAHTVLYGPRMQTMVAEFKKSFKARLGEHKASSDLMDSLLKSIPINDNKSESTARA